MVSDVRPGLSTRATSRQGTHQGIRRMGSQQAEPTRGALQGKRFADIGEV